jgi:hypothetical protein
MPPAYVKPYVKRQKNDMADAEAICEAVTRPTMRFVPVKSVEQQSVLILHRTVAQGSAGERCYNPPSSFRRSQEQQAVVASQPMTSRSWQSRAKAMRTPSPFQQVNSRASEHQRTFEPIAMTFPLCSRGRRRPVWALQK